MSAEDSARSGWRSAAPSWLLQSTGATHPAGRLGGAFLRPVARQRAWKSRSREAVVALALAISLGACLLFTLGAAARSTFLVPSGHAEFPDWLAGPLSGFAVSLPEAVEIGLVAAMLVAWCVVLAAGVTLARATIASIVAMHVVMLIAPPLLSTDVFGYIAFARLDVVHGFSAYADAVDAIASDPVTAFLSPVWPTELSSPYGPLFLIPTYLLAPLGIPASLWGLKALTTGAALGCVALVAAAARRLGQDPVRAAAFVGLNPLWVVWTVGGAHNDLPMMLFALAGVVLLLAGRERLTGAMLAAAIAVKATAGLVALFLLAGARQRGRVLVGGALAGVALLGAFLGVFGTDLFLYVPALLEQSEHVSRHNLPREIVELLGFPEVTPGVKLASGLVFFAVLGGLLVAVVRGAEWISAAGWATIAFLLTTTSLHTWYVAALLPLAALSDSRALRVATVAMSFLLLVIQLTPAA